VKGPRGLKRKKLIFFGLLFKQLKAKLSSSKRPSASPQKLRELTGVGLAGSLAL
jgi:hypothetical protein